MPGLYKVSPNANYRHRAAFHKCEETFQRWNTTLSNNFDSRSFPELDYIGKQSIVFFLVRLPLTHCYELTEVGVKDQVGLTHCWILVELDPLVFSNSRLLPGTVSIVL